MYQLKQLHELLHQFHLHQYPFRVYGDDGDDDEPSLLVSVLLGLILNQHMEFIFFFVALEEHVYQLKLLHVLLHQFHPHRCLLGAFRHV